MERGNVPLGHIAYLNYILIIKKDMRSINTDE